MRPTSRRFRRALGSLNLAPYRDDELAARHRPRPRGRFPLLHHGERDPGHRRHDPRARRKHHGRLQDADDHERDGSRLRGPHAAVRLGRRRPGQREQALAPRGARTDASGQENSPSYGLVSITRDGGPLPNPVSAGPAYRIPAVAGETWVNVGPASSLVVKNGTLYALMWSNRRAPSYQFGMFSTDGGGVGDGLGHGGQSFVANPNFSVGSAMGFVDGPGNTLYGYAASGDAWVVPFSCASPDTPASSSLTVCERQRGRRRVSRTEASSSSATSSPSSRPSSRSRRRGPSPRGASISTSTRATRSRTPGLLPASRILTTARS